MSKIHVLYSPAAGSNTCKSRAEAFAKECEAETLLHDVTKMGELGSFLEGLSEEDSLVICGGDGTLSRFATEFCNRGFKNEVLYLASGSGNDFLRDIDGASSGKAFPVNEYIESLPSVTVNGKTTRFINGVGFGVDGYCCEVGDELRLKSDKPVNYTAIAIKGLLFHFTPANATVCVDGEEHHFKKVWIAPTMFGRFYGGGMMPAPEQRRDDPEGKLSVCIFHGSGKLRTLMVFPKIFSGEHVGHSDMCTVLSGHEITVTFDRPTPLQIDGETVKNVTSYTAQSRVTAKTAVTV